MVRVRDSVSVVYNQFISYVVCTLVIYQHANDLHHLSNKITQIGDCSVGYNQLLVMHRYHFLLTDPIPIYFVLKLADTWPIPILCHRNIIYIEPPIFTAAIGIGCLHYNRYRSDTTKNGRYRSKYLVSVHPYELYPSTLLDITHVLSFALDLGDN